MSHKYQILVFVSCLIVSIVCNAEHHAEIRKVCQAKTKVSDEIVDGLAAGKIPDNKELKCYIECGMNYMKSMKDGKLDKEMTLKMIESMPANLRDPAKNAYLVCDGKFDELTDPCDFAYELMKCWQNENPAFMVA